MSLTRRGLLGSAAVAPVVAVAGREEAAAAPAGTWHGLWQVSVKRDDVMWEARGDGFAVSETRPTVRIENGTFIVTGNNWMRFYPMAEVVEIDIRPAFVVDGSEAE